MVLNLLNLYSLIIALFDKITDMTKELQHLKPNTTTMAPTTTTTTKLTTQFYDQTTTEYSTDFTSLRDITTEISIENITKCYDVVVTCPATAIVKQVTTTLLTMLVANMSTESGFIATDAASTTTNGFIFNENLTFDSYLNSSSAIPYTPYSSSALYSSSSEEPYLSSTVFQDTTYDIYNTTTGSDTTDTTTPTYYYDNAEEGDYQYYSDEALSDNNTESFQQDKLKYVTSLTDNYDLSTSALEIGMLREFMPKDKNEITFLGKGCYITQCRVDDATTVGSTDVESKKTYKMDASYQALIQRDYPFEKASSGNLDMETKRKLRKLCWETMFGQELVKLTMMDLVMLL